MQESYRGRTRAAASLAAGSLALGGVFGAVGLAGTAVAAGEPTVKSLSVTKGSADGGTNVLITGTGFSTVDETTAANVIFGSTNATSFIVLSDTQIAAKAPAGTGSVQVKVTNSTGASADTTSDNFTYITPITAVVPANTVLNAAGGTTFVATLTPTNTLTASADITSKKITATVNGASAKVAFSATDKLSITAPAGTPTTSTGKVIVSVLSDGVTGTVDNTNAKYAAVVTKLSVTSGVVAGTSGSSDKPAITITGVGFKSATGWQFGTNAATCTASSGTKEDTTVTCTNIPQASAAGPVSVNFTPANSAPFGVTSAATYTYTDLG